MAGSTPVHTSKAEGFRSAEEIAALRPMIESAPRPRKPTVLREVTNGIVCFCGERFGEAEALEFMLHLRAEYGEDLVKLERARAWHREYMRNRRATDPEFAERVRAQGRVSHQRRMADPETRARVNERANARFKERCATDPEYRERAKEQRRETKRRLRADPERRERARARERERHRERYASDPEYRERYLAKNRIAQHPDRPCEQCGETFTPARSDKRFCSRTCKNQSYRKVEA